MSKIITVCKCSNCGKPVKVPIKILGQLLAKERKTPNSIEHMTRISQLGVEARRKKMYAKKS